MDNIYTKLAKARVEIQKKCNKKSGQNKYAGFNYFELSDFLTVATEELAKQGLIALFNYEQRFLSKQVTKTSEQGSMEVIDREYYKLAVLTITDGDKCIEFTTPWVPADVKGANGIQNLGSTNTYLKRYLYLNALELSEGDSVDATINKPDDKPKEEPKEEPKKKEYKKVTYATKEQITKILNLFEDEKIETMLDFYKINSLQELPMKIAGEVIARKEELNAADKSGKQPDTVE